MDTKVTTNKSKLHSARQIVESLIEPANTAYYLFYSNHNPLVSEPGFIYDSDHETVIDVYNNMIAGKRIQQNDVSLVIRNIPYVGGAVYDMYDDLDPNLGIKDYYVISDEGSYSHVYKCLDNNRGAASSIEPNFSHITGSNSFIYQTSDGYRWKYMYSVSSSQVLKFGTTEYFPIVPNTTVTAAASPGSVDIIKVEGIGYRYDNYVTGTLSTSNIRVNGNSVLYEIANTLASTFNDFYDGCIMYLTNGVGAGDYQTIIDYVSNNSGKYIVLENEFETSPTNGTEYEIFPEVKVYGSGATIVNCVARALVNSVASNTIYRVEILNRGSGYDFVYAANVVAHESVGISLPAELRPVNSPPQGHGYDVAEELFANSLMFSVKISNTETGTLPATNNFKQIGILQDPVFANVSIEFGTTQGTFAVGEQILQIRPYRVQTNASCNTTSANVDCVGALFLNQFQSGDYVYLASGDGLSHHLGTADYSATNERVVMTTNGIFSCTEVSVYKTGTYSNADVVSSNGTHILLSNVRGTFSTGDQFIGALSGAIGTVATVNINNVEKGFNTFVQMYKYVGALNSGSFQQNEWGIQSNTLISQNSYALVHSTATVGANLVLYTTKQTGEFRAGGSNTITGNTSGSSMRVDEKFPPELVFGSGRVLFVENVNEVTRASDKAETFQIVLAY